MKSPSIEIEIANEMEKKSVVENVNGNCDFAGNRVMCFDVVSLISVFLLLFVCRSVSSVT